MLKSKFFKFSAFSIAAIALAFNFAACDSGNDEYIEEKPHTWAELTGDVKDGTCSAKWTFVTDTASIGGSEVSIEGKEIPPDEGTGATLAGANGLGVKFNAGLQASKKTVNLYENPSDGAFLKLTTTVDTNITVKAKGAGAAEAARILLITDEAGNLKDAEGNYKVAKDNLGSSSEYVFHIEKAPAGVYFIYFNGSTITQIDTTSGTHEGVTEPLGCESNDDLTITCGGKEPTEESSFSFTAITETAQIALKKGSDDLTNSAVWEFLEGEDIADFKNGILSAKSLSSKGDVILRGRYGRFYKDIKVSISENTFVGAYVTILASKNMPAAKTEITDFSESGEDIKNILKAEVAGDSSLVTASDATIEIAEALNKIQVSKVFKSADNTATIGSDIQTKYELKDGKYVETKLSEDGKLEDYSGDEIWKINDPSGANGGLNVKGLGTATDKVDSNKNTLFYTLKLKIKPANGKTLKVTGLMACFNSGKGNNAMQCIVSTGETECATVKSVKNGVVATKTDFSSPVTFSEEKEFIFKISTANNRSGQSVQLKDLSLLISEAE